jgi:hypothetical protein
VPVAFIHLPGVEQGNIFHPHRSKSLQDPFEDFWPWHGQNDGYRQWFRWLELESNVKLQGTLINSNYGSCAHFTSKQTDLQAFAGCHAENLADMHITPSGQPDTMAVEEIVLLQKNEVHSENRCREIGFGLLLCNGSPAAAVQRGNERSLCCTIMLIACSNQSMGSQVMSFSWKSIW